MKKKFSPTRILTNSIGYLLERLVDFAYPIHEEDQLLWRETEEKDNVS